MSISFPSYPKDDMHQTIQDHVNFMIAKLYYEF